PNRMDARQAALYRAAITFGHSYALVLPGSLRDQSAPIITPFSPRKLVALYDDPVNDEWPELAMTFRHPMFDEAIHQDPLQMVSVVDGVRATLYDRNHRYELTSKHGEWYVSEEAEEHGMGVV